MEAGISGKGRLHAADGEWLDAHSAFSGGDGKVSRSESELNDTSWNDVEWDSIKESSAKALLEAETGVIDPDVKEKYPFCIKPLSLSLSLSLSINYIVFAYLVINKKNNK